MQTLTLTPVRGRWSGPSPPDIRACGCGCRCRRWWGGDADQGIVGIDVGQGFVDQFDAAWRDENCRFHHGPDLCRVGLDPDYAACRPGNLVQIRCSGRVVPSGIDSWRPHSSDLHCRWVQSRPGRGPRAGPPIPAPNRAAATPFGSWDACLMAKQGRNLILLPSKPSRPFLLCS